MFSCGGGFDMLDLQKASVLKRISAYILDFIILVICITGVAFFLSSVFGFSKYSDIVDNRKNQIALEHNVNFDIELEEYNALSNEEKAAFDIAKEAFETDEEALKAWNVLINLALLIISFSVLLGYVLTEFIVPLIFKNGQTIGKKVFSLGVMRSHHVKITPAQLFIRSILGKCTMETMFPLYLIIMIFIGSLGIVGLGVLLLFALLQLGLIIFTKNNCFVHDILSDTVVVDLTSQMIFETEEELLEYQKKIHAENVLKSPY